MKYTETDNEKLLEDFEHHYNLSDEIDRELGKRASLLSRPLMNEGKFQEAKQSIRDFFGNRLDKSLYATMLFAEINRAMDKK